MTFIYLSAIGTSFPVVLLYWPRMTIIASYQQTNERSPPPPAEYTRKLTVTDLFIFRLFESTLVVLGSLAQNLLLEEINTCFFVVSTFCWICNVDWRSYIPLSSASSFFSDALPPPAMELNLSDNPPPPLPEDPVFVAGCCLLLMIFLILSIFGIGDWWLVCVFLLCIIVFYEDCSILN